LLLSIIAYILILVFQSIVLFYFLNSILSLWHVSPVYSAVTAGIFLLIQVFLSAPVYDLFFAVRPENESEEDVKKRKKAEEIIRGILDKFNVNCIINIFHETHPLFLSYASITGKNRLVASVGLLEILEPEELEELVSREAYLLRRGDLGIFSAASFLPFVISTASNWCIETAREMKRKRGGGGSFLAGAILFYVYRAAEFFLLVISRSRQAGADESLSRTNKSKQLFYFALEKMAVCFSRPVKSGPSFRKLIYQSLRYFFPYDPNRAMNLLIWKNFIDNSLGIYRLGRLLERENPFYRTDGLFSSHPPLSRRFSFESALPDEDPQIELPFFPDKLGWDIKINILPAILFIIGVIVIIPLGKYFGIPLICLGAGIGILLIYQLWREKKYEGGLFRNYDWLQIEGRIGERRFEGLSYMDSETSYESAEYSGKEDTQIIDSSTKKEESPAADEKHENDRNEICSEECLSIKDDGENNFTDFRPTDFPDAGGGHTNNLVKKDEKSGESSIRDTLEIESKKIDGSPGDNSITPGENNEDYIDMNNKSGKKSKPETWKNLQEEIFETPYYFIDVNSKRIPIIFRQLIRNEEPLFRLISEKVKIDGVIRIQEIPYIEIRGIFPEGGKKRRVLSYNIWFRALLALGLLILGVLMNIVLFIVI